MVSWILPGGSAQPFGTPVRFAQKPQRRELVTLLGNVVPIPEAEVAEARKLYLERYANSKYWVDFEDFSFYRMDVIDVYYVGGFGVMGWITASEYDRANRDPLADVAPDIIQHMNADHADALILIAPRLYRHRGGGGEHEFS